VGVWYTGTATTVAAQPPGAGRIALQQQCRRAQLISACLLLLRQTPAGHASCRGVPGSGFVMPHPASPPPHHLLAARADVHAALKGLVTYRQTNANYEMTR
jgi:hypothetical protein